MQQELDSENPELAISILGVNELGHDSDNSLMTAGRDLPWLQDIDDGGDGNSDTWDSWDVTFRDVIITDSNNVQVTAYNLTNNDLANADNYATLKQLLIDAASATSEPGIATIADQTLTAGSPLHIPLNGFDPAGGQLTFTVESSDPLVSAEVLTGNRSLRMQVDDFGAMTFELFETRTPRATAQIIELAESGFYDGTIFHRVIDNFVIQGGDPTGTGAGGSTLGDFDDQYHVDLQYNRTGLIGMAKTTDDTNDSQFFITEGPIRHLDFNYSIFGVLTEGEDVRAAISDVATDGVQRPWDPVVLHEVEIFDDLENGVLMLSAAEESSGQATITVTVSDSLGNQASRSFEATVVTDLDPSANGNPFLDDIAPVRMEANSTTSFTLTAQDAEGDAVEFLGEDELSAILFSSQIPTLPTELVYSVDATTGVVIVTASDNLIGEHQVRVGVRKPGTVGNDSTIDSQLVSITLGVITVDANDHSSGTQASDGTPDTISLRRNGTDYNVSVNGEIVRTIDESLVHAIDLVGSSDDDLFEIDCSNGPPVMPGGVVITGGSQQTADGDSLSLHTGSFLSVTHRFTDASSGTITLETNAPISYSGLEPISDTLFANDRVFEFGNGDDQVTVGDDSDNANGISRISSIASSGTVDFQMTPGGRIVIRGGNGNDQITAGDLDPTVSTSLTVSGDSGNDTIDASAMTDQVTLLGGGGADKLVGGSNNDKLRGQGGSLDTLTGGPGNDTLDGGSGYDQVSESQDSDFTASNTELVGAGTDTLNDIQVLSLTGGASNNTFDGSAFTGRLFLNGRGGQDTLIGGGGNDKLNGNSGSDQVFGGDGYDVLIIDLSDAASAGSTFEVLAEGTEVIVRQQGGAELSRGTIGQLSQLVLHGTANDDTVLVDFSAGNPLPTGGLSFDATSGGGTDRLELIGSGIGSVAHTFDSSTSGTVTVDGRPIDHSGVSELRDTLATTTRSFTLGDGDDVITVDDDGTSADGISRISLSVYSGTIDFAGPTSQLVISTGNGSDTLTIFGLDSAVNTTSLLLNGQNDSDTLDASGSHVPVKLNGSGGDDVLTGGTANDTLNGGAGADALTGGPGNDRLQGQGSSYDTLSGGPGDDTLDGGEGYDRISETADVDFTATDSSLTGLGSDTLINIQLVQLFGGASDNTINTSAFSGRAFLNGSGGHDTLTGGGWYDRIFGGSGRDLITGGSSVVDPGTDLFTYDVLRGQGGNYDTLIGGDGNDKLNGGIGHDSLVGGGGDDVLTGEAGNDTLDGGEGIDRLYERSNVDMTLTDASLSGGMGSDVLTSIEVAYLKGGNGDNLLDASAFSGDVTLIGVGGDDTLKGGSGNDMLNGRSGADSITGGDGDDTLKGLRDNDVLNGGAGNDWLDGGTQDDRISGWTGDDVLYGRSGNDILVGGDGHDSLYGASGDDILQGDDGKADTDHDRDDDRLDAGTGVDTVRGGGGTDTMLDDESEIDENFTYWAEWVDAV